jgi:hypothetical protein
MMKKLISKGGKKEQRKINLLFFARKSSFLIICLFLLVLQSCSKYSDWELIEYDGDLTWEQITTKAEWSKRLDHEVAILNDELYLAGGYNPGKVIGDPYLEDVWKTSDGETWTNLTKDAPWLGRRGHSLVTFNDGTGDALYVIGGFSVDDATGKRAYNNDVWKSADGENWTEIQDSTDWKVRMHHKCVVANHGGQDYIYLVGGYTMNTNTDGRSAIEYLNDIWRSTDGVDWVNIGITDIGIRSEHAMVVDENGTIYVQGGQHGLIFEAADSSSNPVRDYSSVWQTTDGTTWTSSSDSIIVEADFFSRTSHEMVFYKDRIWALPGKTNSLNHYSFTNSNHYGTWTLDMNGNWDIDSRGVGIDARHNYASIVWKDKIWILGGQTNTNGQDNDIWVGSF